MAIKEYEFGEVKVMEGVIGVGNTPTSIIRFSSQMFVEIEEAEAFMCSLIDAITKARAIVGDPL